MPSSVLSLGCEVKINWGRLHLPGVIFVDNKCIKEQVLIFLIVRNYTWKEIFWTENVLTPRECRRQDPDTPPVHWGPPGPLHWNWRHAQPVRSTIQAFRYTWSSHIYILKAQDTPLSALVLCWNWTHTKCRTHHHYHTSKIHLVLFIKLNTHTHTHTQSIPPNTCPINDKVLLPTETEHTQSIAHTCPLRPTLTSLQEVNTCKAWDPHFKNKHL